MLRLVPPSSAACAWMAASIASATPLIQQPNPSPPPLSGLLIGCLLLKTRYRRFFLFSVDTEFKTGQFKTCWKASDLINFKSKGVAYEKL
jgi:hypothetical protein